MHRCTVTPVIHRHIDYCLSSMYCYTRNTSSHRLLPFIDVMLHPSYIGASTIAIHRCTVTPVIHCHIDYYNPTMYCYTRNTSSHRLLSFIDVMLHPSYIGASTIAIHRCTVTPVIHCHIDYYNPTMYCYTRNTSSHRLLSFIDVQLHP